MSLLMLSHGCTLVLWLHYKATLVRLNVTFLLCRQDFCPCLQMHFTAAAKAARCSQQRKQPPLLAGHKIHVHQAGTQKDGPSAADLRRLVAAFGGKVCCAVMLTGICCPGPCTVIHAQWAASP